MREGRLGRPTPPIFSFFASLPEVFLMSAIEDVMNERQRQIDAEGWTSDHDDQHVNGELRIAAACYAGDTRKFFKAAPPKWPWSQAWWKPKSLRENLVRAAALIIAEIERLDRLAEKSK
jgi:hypothetical protein